MSFYSKQRKTWMTNQELLGRAGVWPSSQAAAQVKWVPIPPPPQLPASAYFGSSRWGFLLPIMGDAVSAPGFRQAQSCLLQVFWRLYQWTEVLSLSVFFCLFFVFAFPIQKNHQLYMEIHDDLCSLMRMIAGMDFKLTIKSQFCHLSALQLWAQSSLGFLSFSLSLF